DAPCLAAFARHGNDRGRGQAYARGWVGGRSLRLAAQGRLFASQEERLRSGRRTETDGFPCLATAARHGPSRSHGFRKSFAETPIAIPHIASKGIRLASPWSPIRSPRLNAPNCPLAPASDAVSIESRLVAICPDQNDGHEEC